jgi:predicted transposase YbfD/YdcC
MPTTFLSDVKDFRRLQGQRYGLSHTLLFSFLAICCNANTYRQIGLFISTYFEKLSSYYNLSWKAAPHYITIRNHIKGVCADELEAAFRAFTQHLLPADAFLTKAKYNHIAVDGKTLCGSNDATAAKRAVQSFSFFNVAYQLILGQIEIAEKTNEIPVFQQLLEVLQIPNAIFTADAMHLQKNTFQIADQKQHGLLIQLKDNQKELEDDVTQILKLEQPLQTYVAPIEQGHGRIENRKATVYQHRISDHILDQQWAHYIKTVVCIERRRQTKNTSTGIWEVTEEKSIYLSNKIIDAQYANQLIRDHWGIENKNHYVRDVSFNEDNHKIKRQSFNYSILRSFALNFFRSNKIENIKEQRYAFSLDWTKLYSYPQII